MKRRGHVGGRVEATVAATMKTAATATAVAVAVAVAVAAVAAAAARYRQQELIHSAD